VGGLLGPEKEVGLSVVGIIFYSKDDD